VVVAYSLRVVTDLIVGRAFQLACCVDKDGVNRANRLRTILFRSEFIATDNRCVRFSRIYDLVVGRTHPFTKYS
jgi:hypothetical protein